MVQGIAFGADHKVHLPARFNVAVPFIDRHVGEGRGTKAAIKTAHETVSYAELGERVNRAGSALLALGLTDSFRMFEQPEKSYSWWDYRMLGYQKNRGLRIDHILVSEPLVPRVKGCVIDRVPRKWEKPSDHAPVVLDLDQGA